MVFTDDIFNGPNSFKSFTVLRQTAVTVHRSELMSNAWRAMETEII